MCVAAGMVGAAVAGSVVSSALAPSGNSGGGGAQGAAAAADPFASQRGQYQSMLSNLIQDPSSITNQPGYQFGLNQAMQSVQGSAAANGMLNSGNTLTALQDRSQNYASTALNNQELLLAQLAGANVGSPGTAGQILQNQNQANQQSASAFGNLAGQAVNQGINSYFSSPTYSSNPFGMPGDYGTGSNPYGFSSGVGVAGGDYSSISGGMFGG